MVEPPLQLLDHRLVDRFLDEQARTRAADVTLVEVDAVDDALDGLVESRVVEDHVRRLPAELEGEALVRLPASSLIALPTRLSR